MKKIAAMLVLMTAMLCGKCWAEGVNSEDAKKVFMLITRNTKDAWTATAFYISTTRLLTAAHTFKKSNDQWIVKDGREVHCKIVKIDFDKDIALIECDDPCETYFRLISELKVIGFPFGNPAITSPGRIDSKRIHAHAYFVAGMSGSPLVNEYGDVEGMGVQGDLFKDKYNCRAIPASDLADFVKDK